MWRPLGPVQAASDEGAALSSQSVDVDTEIREWGFVDQVDDLVAVAPGTGAGGTGTPGGQRASTDQRGIQLHPDLTGQVVVTGAGPAQRVAVPGLTQAVHRWQRRSEPGQHLDRGGYVRAGQLVV